jgi:hypothetical protein
LSAAKVLEIFDAKVNGLDSDALGFLEKPDPAMLLELTGDWKPKLSERELLRVQSPEFGLGARDAALVVGVNRTQTAGQLVNSGADVEVNFSQVAVGVD